MSNRIPSSSPDFVKNDPKVINGWALFDWANSAFALVITVAIFPGYYEAVTDDTIFIFGVGVSNSSLFAFAISAAYLIIAAFSPFLSGVADYGGRKMGFLKFFTTLGGLSCLALLGFTTDPATWALGTICFMLGMIGFAGGLVFYNSYLPEIATEDRYDSVSARGFAFGYIGSVLLLIFNLMMVEQPGWFGLPEEGTLPARIAFVTVGLWWMGFAQIPFSRLPPDEPRSTKGKKLARRGWEELKKVWRALQEQVQIQRFLLSFFCYSAGVQTVLYMAAIFAAKELDFATAELIILVLILQIVAIGGAYLFAWVSSRRGNKFSLATMLVIWTLICITAYFIQTSLQFYALAVAVGLVMGGVQSMSRSTYSKLLPVDTPDTTSYFSFYDVLEKVAIVLGTFIFGLFDALTGGMRNSILALAVFFLIGLVLLLRVTVRPAKVIQ